MNPNNESELKIDEKLTNYSQGVDMYGKIDQPAMMEYRFETMGNQEPSIRLMSILSDAVSRFTTTNDEKLSNNDLKAIAIWFEKMYNV